MDLPVIEPSPPAAAGCSAGSCGSTARQMDALSDAVRARVQDHPCYSEDAHHYFAPVSYTHLDVYKRQVQRVFRRQRCMSSVMPNPSLRLTFASWPHRLSPAGELKRWAPHGAKRGRGQSIA